MCGDEKNEVVLHAPGMFERNMLLILNVFNRSNIENVSAILGEK